MHVHFGHGGWLDDVMMIVVARIIVVVPVLLLLVLLLVGVIVVPFLEVLYMKAHGGWEKVSQKTTTLPYQSTNNEHQKMWSFWF